MIVVVKYLFLGMFVALMSLLAFAHEGETGKKRSRKRDKRRRRQKKLKRAKEMKNGVSEQ